MGSPTPSAVVFGAGRLAYGCTDLTTAWPHGGTGLGLAREVHLAWDQRHVELIEEETGGPRELLYVGGRIALVGDLEDWDVSAVTAVFPSGTTSGGARRVDVPGDDVTPGLLVAALTSLVYTPRSATHPAILLHRAAPMVEVAARLAWSALRPLVVPVAFVGLPDASERVAQVGLLSGLTL